MNQKLLTKLRRQTAKAISDFSMISEGDKILVAVSGGKDSAVLLYILNQLAQVAPVNFTITPVILDQKQPGFDVLEFQTWVRDATGLDLVIVHEDTYSIVKEKTPEGQTYCALCSRLRRGILYTYAKTHGYTKIALGHHREDLNTTLLLNMFYLGTTASMPPKLYADDNENIVIRPLAYCGEDEIAELAHELRVAIIPCNLCGSQDGLKRARINRLIQDLTKEIPHLRESLLAAQRNIKPSQLADLSITKRKVNNPKLAQKGSKTPLTLEESSGLI